MEFPDLGEHCQLNSCKQLDFLPVTCGLCSKTFCSTHGATPERHDCQKLHLRKDNKVEVCKKCNRKLVLGHKCEVKKRSKCSVENCKSKILIPLTCPDCFQKLCPRHRFPADHDCIHLSRRFGNMSLITVSS